VAESSTVRTVSLPRSVRRGRFVRRQVAVESGASLLERFDPVDEVGRVLVSTCRLIHIGFDVAPKAFQIFADSLEVVSHLGAMSNASEMPLSRGERPLFSSGDVTLVARISTSSDGPADEAHGPGTGKRGSDAVVVDGEFGPVFAFGYARRRDGYSKVSQGQLCIASSRRLTHVAAASMTGPIGLAQRFF
jgi:hypothetical protein